jgi:hypothetical protein
MPNQYKLWQATYHGHRVRVRCRIRVPLHRHLAGRTSIRTIIAGLARLVRAHGPAAVLFTRRDGYQASIGRKRAGRAPLRMHIRPPVVTVVVLTAVVMLGGLDGDGAQ